MSALVRKKFTPDEIATFCEQTAMLLNGGVPLYEGTGILYEEMDEGETRTILEEIDNNVKTGMPFWQALDESRAFPNYMVHMVEIGENTGKLEDIMRALAKYYERENAVNVGIRGVIMYPAMLFVMMAIILVVLVTRILPMFESVFTELDHRSGSTDAMMSTSIAASRVLTAIILVIVIAIAAILLWYRTRKGAGSLTALIGMLPFTKGLSEKLGIGTFLAAMSVMVSSGMETGEAMEKAELVVEDVNTAARVKECRGLVNDGRSLDQALAENQVLTGMQARMLGVGVKAGNVDQVLSSISAHYDEEINDRMNNLSAHIETALVVALSVIVGVILVSVMMPLISVIASI